MRPICDRNSTKYPDRKFYAGYWSTPEQIEAHRARRRSESGRLNDLRYRKSEKGQMTQLAHHKRNNPRRVVMCAGGIQFYVGMAPTTEDAQHLRRMIREESPRGLE